MKTRLLLVLAVALAAPCQAANERAMRSLAYWRYQALKARLYPPRPYTGTDPLPGGPLPPSWQITQEQTRMFNRAAQQWQDWHDHGQRPFGYPLVHTYGWRRR